METEKQTTSFHHVHGGDQTDIGISRNPEQKHCSIKKSETRQYGFISFLFCRSLLLGRT
jgi:hypothetical protein